MVDPEIPEIKTDIEDVLDTCKEVRTSGYVIKQRAKENQGDNRALDDFRKYELAPYKKTAEIAEKEAKKLGIGFVVK